MVKTLEEVIRKAENWSVEDQEELAEFAREIEARRSGIYAMSDAERAAVKEGLAQADRGEFVPDDVVAKADKRHGS
jgi:predicted transcriptional regulator